MEKIILNYRVIVEPDTRVGTSEKCYTAYCPTLGIADDADTIDKALASIKEGIRCYVEALLKEGKEIPAPDNIDEGVVTNIKVSFFGKPHLAPL